MTTCYLCKNKKLKVLKRGIRDEEKRIVYECGKCGLVFLEPKKENLREWYKGEYRKTSSPVIGKPLSSQEIFNKYVDASTGIGRFHLVKKYLSKNKRVLDVGCSAGHFLYHVKPYVKEVVGIDLNVSNIKYLKRKLGMRAYATPIEETDLPKDYFDIIFSFNTLEHIEDPVSFLESFKPYLKKRGIMYFGVPNTKDSLLSVYKNNAYGEFFYHKPHLFYYSPKTLKRLFEKAGYRGKVIPFQMYNFINAMHWILTESPQKDGYQGVRTPVLIENNKEVPVSLQDEFNTWIKNVDQQYKKMLEKHFVTDQVIFVGKKAA